jgi:lipoprotein-anchoring transpeptidase ErfK/SrfK
MRNRIIIGIIIVLAIFIVLRLNNGKKKVVQEPEQIPVKQSEIMLNTALDLKGKNTEQAVEALEKVAVEFAQTPEAEQALYEIAEIYNKGQDKNLEKQALKRLISEYPNSDKAQEALNRIAEINLDSLFSNAEASNSTIYEVQPGDSLYKIAKQHGTNVELIKKVNNLSSNLIKPGMKLKIITSVFTIEVSKSDRLLTLKADGDLVKVYKVGVGKDNSTPVGRFKIVNRIENPVWYKTGAIVPSGSAENILGTRWMGFSEPGYGIHGTVDDQPIQDQKTQGCIRMMNNEVEELFVLVPVGTEVVITE